MHVITLNYIRRNISICHVHQRLEYICVKHPILLPQVQHADYFGLENVRKFQYNIQLISIKFLAAQI